MTIGLPASFSGADDTRTVIRRSDRFVPAPETSGQGVTWNGWSGVAGSVVRDDRVAEIEARRARRADRLRLALAGPAHPRVTPCPSGPTDARQSAHPRSRARGKGVSLAGSVVLLAATTTSPLVRSRTARGRRRADCQARRGVASPRFAASRRRASAGARRDADDGACRRCRRGTARWRRVGLALAIGELEGEWRARPREGHRDVHVVPPVAFLPSMAVMVQPGARPLPGRRARLGLRQTTAGMPRYAVVR